jgi:hypothetical protein
MKAIESIPLSLSAGLSREDLTNLIKSLIDNHEVREIITKSLLSPYDNKSLGLGRRIERQIAIL